MVRLPVGPAAGRSARRWVGDLRVWVEALLPAQAGDLAGESVAVVAVGDRRVARSVCGVADRAVALDVDAVVQAVALERDR